MFRAPDQRDRQWHREEAAGWQNTGVIA